MSLIVIVDDRVTNRNIFAKLAASIEPDVTVQTFGDPRDALAWLAANAPDLVVTDYKMPHHDGADFVRLFREIPGRGDIPVVVITVLEERTFRLRALEAGATDFLISPVDHHEFITRARNLLALHGHQSRLAAQATTRARELEDGERARGRRLRQSFETLAQVVDALPALVSATGPDGALLFANAAQTAFSNVALDDIVGRPPSVLFGAEAGARSAAMDRLVVRGNAQPCVYQDTLEGPAGARMFLVSKTPLPGDGDAPPSVLTSATDVTEQARIAAGLRHRASHDAATGLPNAVQMRARLRALAQGVARGERPFALHLLHVDTPGERDRPMPALAARLRTAIRADDLLARWSDRAFAVLQMEGADAADVADLATRLRASIAAAGFDASIGAAVCEGDDASVMARARAALAAARSKRAGVLVSGKRDPPEGHPCEALARGELALGFRLHRRAAVTAGAEALALWPHARARWPDPAVTAAGADDDALDSALHAWLLRQACLAAAAWRRVAPELAVTVYIPTHAMGAGDIVALAARSLAEAAVPAEALVVETPARTLRDDRGRAACEALRARGVGVSLEAAAAEILALSHLSRAPITRVRLDAGEADDAEGASALRRAVLHAHSLELDVLAADVRTPEQAAWFADAGVHLVAEPSAEPPSTLAACLEAATRSRREGAA